MVPNEAPSPVGCVLVPPVEQAATVVAPAKTSALIARLGHAIFNIGSPFPGSETVTR
jgi:hypothetical protein